tara:strand:- start:84 stop:1049 length:966 start_codon:yes stop_codon:yes gene_type:complete
MKLLFLGQGKVLCEICLALLAKGHKIAGVITYPKEEHDRDILERQCEMKYGLYKSVFEYCEEKDIKLLQATNLDEQPILAWLKEIKIDLVISIRSRLIMRAAFVELFKNRIINLHIGMLPQYRGSGAMSWMIMNGEKKTSVTYHNVDVGIDSGDILRQIELDIPSDAYPIDIYKHTSELFIATAPKLIEDFYADRIKAIPQDKCRATYYPRLRTMIDGVIDFNMSPQEVERFVRAFGWPYAGPFCKQGKKQIHFARTKVIPDGRLFHSYMNGLVISNGEEKGSVWVVCGQGVLEVLSVRVANDEVSAVDEIRVGRRLNGIH